MRHTPNTRVAEKGVVLLASLVAVVIVSALAAVMFTTARAELQGAETNRSVTRVTQLAEAATVRAEADIIQAVANLMPMPEGGDMTLAGVTVPYTIAPVGNSSTQTDPNGIQTIHERYVVEATAQRDGYNKRVNRVLDVGLTPIFQFAIFYDKDLELLPGPTMTLTGRVHSNADIYVGTGNNSTLTIASNYFRCVGEMFRRRKENGNNNGGTVRIQKGTSNLFEDMYSASQLQALGVPSPGGYDSDFLGWDANGDGDLSDLGDWADFAVGALDLWEGTVQTGAHGVKRVEPPNIGSIKRFENVGAGQGDWAWSSADNDWTFVGSGNGDHRKGRYYDAAGLIVEDGQAFAPDGTPLTLPPGTVSVNSMYDAREGQVVTVTDIDVDLLNQSGHFPANGLIYAFRNDAVPGNPSGIRLVNGEELGGPLTLASENPVYVWGDYNTVNKKPASVICDAVNLLSNAWDDSKTKGSLPSASETRYNFAMITGGDETIGGKYNGGFENLPRFHEKWSGIKCHITGSFVKIFASEIATGAWKYGGDRYKAPKRLWDYDQSFNNAGSLPPFTPNVAQVKSSGWWE